MRVINLSWRDDLAKLARKAGYVRLLFQSDHVEALYYVDRKREPLIRESPLDAWARIALWVLMSRPPISETVTMGSGNGQQGAHQCQYHYTLDRSVVFNGQSGIFFPKGVLTMDLCKIDPKRPLGKPIFVGTGRLDGR